jgi:imidazolonepropionase-like amidohydrolase
MSHYVSSVTVFDGRTVKTKQGVHVAGGTIEWVGAHARAPRVARAAAEVPGADRLLMPGLIDCHVHLVFDGNADFEQEAKELTPALAAIKAVNNARRNLEAGVTTLRDLGGLGSVSCEVGGAIERGLISGPRVLAAGRALTVTGGHGHNIGIAREVDGPDAMRRAVREEIRGGARAIKVMATGGVLTPGIGATFTAYSQEEIEAAVDEAHKWGRSVAAHAIGAGGILNAVRAGVDSIEHCNDVTTEVAREMKERGTFRSPTLCALRGITEHPDEVPGYAVKKALDTMEMSRAGMRRALREGVRHVCGTDAGTPFNPHGSAPREIVSMVQWGMTPLKALQAATANGAELLGLTMAGRIDVGAEADLVLYEGNPLEEIERVLVPVLVMRAGDVVAGALA